MGLGSRGLGLGGVWAVTGVPVLSFGVTRGFITSQRWGSGTVDLHPPIFQARVRGGLASDDRHT